MRPSILKRLRQIAANVNSLFPEDNDTHYIIQTNSLTQLCSIIPVHPASLNHHSTNPIIYTSYEAAEEAVNQIKHQHLFN